MTTKKEDVGLSARADFRVEPELKRKIVEMAESFHQSEGDMWRMLVCRALGDGAPETVRNKFLKLLGMME